MPYTVRVEREVYHPQHTHNVQHRSWFEPVSHQRAASLPRFADHCIQSDSDSQVSAADLGSPQQYPPLIRAIQRPRAPLSAKRKSQRYLFPPMETKHSTKYEVRKGSIELWSSSIRVIDESGDTVEIDFPYTAFRDALKNFVVHSLSQSTQEELIELMTNDTREREQRRLERDAEIAAESN